MVGASGVKSTVDSTHKTRITFIISAEHWPFGRTAATPATDAIAFWVSHLLEYYKYLCDLKCTVNHVHCNRFLFFMMMESSLSYSMGDAVSAVTSECVCVRALRHIKHKSNCHIILVVDVCVNIEIFALPLTHTHTHSDHIYVRLLRFKYHIYVVELCTQFTGKNLSFAIMSSSLHQ